MCTDGSFEASYQGAFVAGLWWHVLSRCGFEPKWLRAPLSLDVSESSGQAGARFGTEVWHSGTFQL